MVGIVAPASPSEANLGEAQEAFALFDKQSSGSIETKDLGMVLRALGYSVSASQLKEIEKDADPEGSGYVKQSDFMRSVSKAESLAKASNIGAKKAIKEMGAGVQSLLEGKKVKNPEAAYSISAADFKHMMTRVGEKVSASEYNDMIKDLEMDGNRIKLDTLVSFLNL